MESLSRRIAAVILNWNCAEDTLRCAEAVLSGETVPLVIVVDNGSTDGSLDRLTGGPFELVPLDRNLGFAGGMNAGIRAALEQQADYVWLLNADCVPSKTALSALIARADRFDVMASLQVTSAEPGIPGEPYVAAANLKNGRVQAFVCPGCAAGEHAVDIVTGASLFAATEWVARVGLIDERFFHYKEEFDLVFRIGAAGGRVGLACASEVWHRRGGSLNIASARAQYYHYRNELLFVRKHYAHPLRRIFFSEPVHFKNLATAAAGLFAPTKRTRSKAVFAGYWDGLRGVYGPTERF